MMSPDSKSSSSETEEELQEREDEIRAQAAKLQQIADELRLKKLQIRLGRLVEGTTVDSDISSKNSTQKEPVKLVPWPTDRYAVDRLTSEDKNVDTWCYDKERNCIYFPITGKYGFSSLGDTEIVSLILHEIGHARYSSPVHPSIYQDPQLVWSQMVNMFEDIRVESKMTFKFPGSWDFLSDLYKFLDDGIDKEALASLPDYVNYLVNVFRVSWGLEPLFSEKAQYVYNKTSDFIKTVPFFSSSEQMAKGITKEIWPLLKDLAKQDEEKGNDGAQNYVQSVNKKKMALAQKEMDRQEKMNKKRQEHSASNPNEPYQPTEEEKKESEDALRELRALENQLKSATGVFKDVSDIKEALKGMSSADLSRVDELEQEKEKMYHDLKNTFKGNVFEDGDMGNPTDKATISSKVNAYSRNNKVSFEDLFAEVEPYITFFSRKMRSIMKDNRLIRHGGNFRSGRLNTKELAKWKCGKTRLFTKQIYRSHKDYSVSLIIDESGSMSGQPIKQAALSAVLLSEVLHRCKIDFEIVGFNASTRIYKKYTDRYTWTIRRNLENILAAVDGSGSGSTNDAYELACANERLKGRRGERIVMLLSDGSPNPCSSNIPLEVRRGRLANMASYTDFDLATEIAIAGTTSYIMGIGINTTSVQQYYPNNAVVNDVSTLPLSVLNLLKKRIKRG